MALDSPPSSTPPSPTMTSTVTSVTSTPSEVAFRQLVDMWHPHVYGTPPKSPTPFSIDDILKRPQSASTNPATDMAEGLKKLMPGWAHLINNFILQQQYTVFDYGANVAEIQNFYRQQAQLRYWCHMKGSCMGKFLEDYFLPPFEFEKFYRQFIFKICNLLIKTSP